MNELAILVCAALCGAVWIGFVAPNISRLFGVPARIAFWREPAKGRRLSRQEWIWARGVLGWGLGMFIITNADDYLRWRILGEQSWHSVLSHIVVGLVVWCLAGWFFGKFTFNAADPAHASKIPG